jgi:hypothetical protein
LERAQAALAADADWLDFIDREAGPAFAPEAGLTTQRIFRRIG